MDDTSSDKKCNFHCVTKYFLFTVNILVWAVGAILIGVGAWALQEKSGYSDISSLAFNPAVLLIVAGGLTFLIAFCGCVGALRENKLLLKVYMGILLVIFILELIAGFIAFFFAEEVKGKVESGVKKAIIHYRDDPDHQDAIDDLQSGLKCCGGFSYHDWDANEYFNCSAKSVEACGVPYSCCRKDKINTQCGFGVRKEMLNTEANQVIYTEGCIDSLKTWLRENLYLVGGLAYGLVLIQLLGILGAMNLIRDIDQLLASSDKEMDMTYML